MPIGEIWKDIVNYEGIYQVSNIGRVRSFDRVVTYKDGRVVRRKGCLRKYSIHPKGYLQMLLYNGKLLTRKVHRLVAQAFIPNPKNLPQINHKNGIKTDNRVENLEWCTNRQNAIHSRKNGLQKTKLSINDVVKIKELLKQGCVQRVIAEKYNVDRTTIYDINIGRTWKERLSYAKI